MSALGELMFLVNDNPDKPLNQQINDMIGLLEDENQVYSIKDLGAISSIPNNEEHKSSKALKANCGGTIKVKAFISLSAGCVANSAAINYVAKLYKNDVVIKTVTSLFTALNEGVTVEISVAENETISINKGDKLSLSLQIPEEYIFTTGYYWFSDVNFRIQINARPAIIGTNLIETE